MMGVYNKFFIPDNPADKIEAMLMNCVKDYCESHPVTMDVLEAMKHKNEEEQRLFKEDARQLFCELVKA